MLFEAIRSHGQCKSMSALWCNVFIRHSPPFHSSTHPVKYEANAVRLDAPPH
jgi:hypothetical protein